MIIRKCVYSSLSQMLTVLENFIQLIHRQIMQPVSGVFVYKPKKNIHCECGQNWCFCKTTSNVYFNIVNGICNYSRLIFLRTLFPVLSLQITIGSRTAVKPQTELYHSINDVILKPELAIISGIVWIKIIFTMFANDLISALGRRSF